MLCAPEHPRNAADPGSGIRNVIPVQWEEFSGSNEPCTISPNTENAIPCPRVTNHG
jgi:hypothetical protein